MFVCLWAEHKVSVYCLSMSLRGSGGADGQSAIDSLWSLHSIQYRASAGWPSPA